MGTLNVLVPSVVLGTEGSEGPSREEGGGMRRRGEGGRMPDVIYLFRPKKGP
jgi:hypothetical protein